MIKLSEYKFMHEPTRGDIWYSIANSWNSEGVRAAKWPGYLVARKHPHYTNGIIVYYYRHMPDNPGLKTARIDVAGNKLNHLDEALTV